METRIESKEALKVAMRSGEIMMSNGAETHRVEDTMCRILAAYGFRLSDSFVITTGIIASVQDDTDTVTQVKRVSNRSIQLDKIAAVNELSRNIVEQKTSPKEAYKRLNEINEMPPYPLLLKVVLCGVSCFCFCYMFGGGITDCASAFMTGLVIYFIYNRLVRNNVVNFLATIICSCIIAICSLIFLNIGFTVNPDYCVMGSIMPLVPGMGITNAVRDVFAGDYLSGTSRIVDAVIIAVSIATGIGVVFMLWLFIFGGFII